MKRLTMLGLCAAVMLALLSAPALCDEAKERGRQAYPKANDPAKPLRLGETKVLSREVFGVPPFFIEEIIKTTDGVKKITTFLLFIRVETRNPR